MRLLVVGTFEAGSGWAYAINTVKMAEGFASLGHDVWLVCHRSDEQLSDSELAQRYGITSEVHWVRLPKRIGGRQISNHWGFTFLAFPVLMSVRPDLIYARTAIFTWLCSRMGFKTVLEGHSNPENEAPYFRRMLDATHHRSFRCWITISDRLAQGYAERGAVSKKLVVLPDAVDLDLFTPPKGLPSTPFVEDGPHVVYAGHLYDYKGIPIILKAASRMPDVVFHLVGGWEQDQERHRQSAVRLGLRNLRIHGLKPHSAVPPYLWHADALLLPPSALHPSAQWTSPLKLGEYLAAGVPVVASRIPALVDWVTDDHVCFFAPDDAESLADSIAKVLSDRRYAANLTRQARDLACSFSYEKRAAAIIDASV